VIADRIGLHSVLLPFADSYNNNLNDDINSTHTTNSSDASPYNNVNGKIITGIQ